MCCRGRAHEIVDESAGVAVAFDGRSQGRIEQLGWFFAEAAIKVRLYGKPKESVLGRRCRSFLARLQGFVHFGAKEFVAKIGSLSRQEEIHSAYDTQDLSSLAMHKDRRIGSGIVPI